MIRDLCVYEQCNDSVKELALLLTQYEQYGSVGHDEFLELVHDEFFLNEVSIYDLSDYNDFLLANNYCDDYLTDDLNELLQGLEPERAFWMGAWSDVNGMSQYYNFNGNGNIQGYEEYEVVKMIKDSKEFFDYCIENELLEIDSEFEENVIDECNKLLKAGY